MQKKDTYVGRRGAWLDQGKMCMNSVKIMECNLVEVCDATNRVTDNCNTITETI